MSEKEKEFSKYSKLKQPKANKNSKHPEIELSSFSDSKNKNKKVKDEKKESLYSQSENQELLRNIRSFSKSTYNSSSNANDQGEYYLPIEKDIPVFKDDLNSERNKTKTMKFDKVYKHKGNMHTFFHNKDDNPLIVIGPHWPFATCMLAFIGIASILHFYFISNRLKFFLKFIGLSLSIIQFISYLACIIINPGIPPSNLRIDNFFKDENNKEDISNYRICNICKIVMQKEDLTEHCEECNICILGYDHHCPWTSKCIGKKNKKIFNIFILSTLLMILDFFVNIIMIHIS